MKSAVARNRIGAFAFLRCYTCHLRAIKKFAKSLRNIMPNKLSHLSYKVGSMDLHPREAGRSTSLVGAYTQRRAP